MTTTASGIRQDQTPTTANPLRLWHEAVSRYLETRKGGPDRNTARTYGRTPRAYKDFALESGLNPWGADALIGYNAQQNGLRKANGGDLAEDTKAARLTHAQGFLRWGYIHGATPLTPEMVKGFIHKPRVKQLSPRDILDTSEVRAMPKVARSAALYPYVLRIGRHRQQEQNPGHHACHFHYSHRFASEFVHVFPEALLPWVQRFSSVPSCHIARRPPEL